MTAKKLVSPSGEIELITDQELDVEEFHKLLGGVANLFSVKPNWISMPEAEIGKVITCNGEIYGKIDFSYGTSLLCKGLTPKEQTNLEKFLSTTKFGHIN